MELVFIGTGAADYLQVLRCTCPICTAARSLGGRNIRTHASLLVDRCLLVDCGPTVPWRLAEEHASACEVRHMLFTHSHGDHLDPDAVKAIAQAQPPGGERSWRVLEAWGNAAAMKAVAAVAPGVTCHGITPGWQGALDDHEVLALPASHIPEQETALTFVLRRGDVAFLYATDTAWPPDSWWELLAGVALDAAVVEATFGPLGPDGHPDCLTQHLNWSELSRLVAELRVRGILKPQAPVLATHLSQHFVPPHDQWAPDVEREGLRVAYDGLRITL